MKHLERCKSKVSQMTQHIFNSVFPLRQLNIIVFTIERTFETEDMDEHIMTSLAFRSDLFYTSSFRRT